MTRPVARKSALLAAAAIVAVGLPFLASEAVAQPRPQQAPAAATPPAPAPAQQPAQQAAQPPAQQAPAGPNWTDFPGMVVERVFRGPLRDTVIQRLHDPADGSVCFVYVPISTPIAAQGGQYVQYGPHNIGNISCIPSPRTVQAQPPADPAARPGTPARNSR